MSWILILSIITTEATFGTVTSVPGFESEAACAAAGAAWRTSIKDLPRHATAYAVCVKTD